MGVIAAVVLAGAAALALWARPGTPAPTQMPIATGAAAASGGPALVRADSPALGPADAPVTLVEFLDPECEACRAFYPIVKELLAEYPDELRLVVRYVPGHANSALAVIALEAAGAQDRYWEMLDALFETQPGWGERQTPQTAAFLELAASLGLDMDVFAAAMERADITTLERDLGDVRAFGIRATPTFFVDGVELATTSEAGLREAVGRAVAEHREAS
jgi:protein-disulfide isomerase